MQFHLESLADPIVISKASLSLKDFDKISPNYYKNTIASIALDFIRGYLYQTFPPKQYVNRAEAAIVSYRLMVKLSLIPDSQLEENILISKNKLEQEDVMEYISLILQIQNQAI